MLDNANLHIKFMFSWRQSGFNTFMHHTPSIFLETFYGFYGFAWVILHLGVIEKWQQPNECKGWSHLARDSSVLSPYAISFVPPTQQAQFSIRSLPKRASSSFTASASFAPAFPFCYKFCFGSKCYFSHPASETPPPGRGVANRKESNAIRLGVALHVCVGGKSAINKRQWVWNIERGKSVSEFSKHGWDARSGRNGAFCLSVGSAGWVVGMRWRIREWVEDKFFRETFQKEPEIC